MRMAKETVSLFKTHLMIFNDNIKTLITFTYDLCCHSYYFALLKYHYTDEYQNIYKK